MAAVEADRGKHEDSRSHLNQEPGRASYFPSPVRERLEPEGSSGSAAGMEEKKRFLCGVVEGKLGRLQYWIT